ncbi:Rv2175c family DNA-binding protein [Plantactinospora siamensis]|uniref:Rv2175c family DNA-binding protein n=1 Tax=Plantactinospora siamensis TaxID=555372 RepID=A0ABV6NZP2_9ACTN
MSEPISAPTDRSGPAGPAGWLTLPDVAERLEVNVTRVHRMIREGQLIAVPRDGVRRVPTELVANHTVLKHLPGILTLLRDAGYDDEEIVGWLYQPDETLPGTPAAALGGDRAREVKRRAQALGF